MAKLGRLEVNKVISYIGVNENGYLGEFSYAKLTRFYLDIDLDINPFDPKYSGSTRNRFETILTESEASIQARIILGILEIYPLSDFKDQIDDEYKNFSEKDYKNKEKLHDNLIQYASSLQGENFDFENLKHDMDFVKKALEQANTLIKNHSFSSAVDRTHTAIHYYLKDLCKNEGITFESDLIGVQHIWTRMKTDHPSFNIDVKDSQKPINQTVNAISKFLENMNDIRNKYNFAHPTEEVIDEDEAKFIISIASAFLFYIDSKTQSL